MSDLPVITHDAFAAVAALCARAIENGPTADELEVALFGSEQPALVRGDPETGIVATVAGDRGTHIRLLAVDPHARGRGHGHALLNAAEADARAAGSGALTTGGDAPFYLWPGIPSTETAFLCLLERHKYARVDTCFDMGVDLATIPDDPGGHAFATPTERDELDAWLATHWANWRAEVLRALDKNNLVIARDTGGAVSAFCAFEVNRTGFLGPVGVRPDLLGQGAGKGVLLGALHELRRRGRTYIDVAWVGPVVPYAAVGGRVSNVYFVHRKKLT